MSAENNPGLQDFIDLVVKYPVADVLTVMAAVCVETIRAKDDLKRLARIVLIELDMDPDEVYSDFIERPNAEEVMYAAAQRMKQLMAAAEEEGNE